MELTGGTRTALSAAGVGTLASLGLTLHGVLTDNLPQAVGGTCTTITALTLLALTLIRHWIGDTRDERTILAAAQREAQAERTRFIAARAALENEQGRLTRDLNKERMRLAADQIAERNALRAEFEERRATLICETMEATIQMINGGKLTPDNYTTGRLIQFPSQDPSAAAPQRERTREHGSVWP